MIISKRKVLRIIFSVMLSLVFAFGNLMTIAIQASGGTGPFDDPACSITSAPAEASAPADGSAPGADDVSADSPSDGPSTVQSPLPEPTNGSANGQSPAPSPIPEPTISPADSQSTEPDPIPEPTTGPADNPIPGPADSPTTVPADIQGPVETDESAGNTGSGSGDAPTSKAGDKPETGLNLSSMSGPMNQAAGDDKIKVSLQRGILDQGKANYTFITEIYGADEEDVTGYDAEFKVINNLDGNTEYLDFDSVTPIGVEGPFEGDRPYKYVYSDSIVLPQGENYIF